MFVVGPAFFNVVKFASGVESPETRVKSQIERLGFADFLALDLYDSTPLKSGDLPKVLGGSATADGV